MIMSLIIIFLLLRSISSSEYCNDGEIETEQKEEYVFTRPSHFIGISLRSSEDIFEGIVSELMKIPNAFHESQLQLPSRFHATIKGIELVEKEGTMEKTKRMLDGRVKDYVSYHFKKEDCYFEISHLEATTYGSENDDRTLRIMTKPHHKLIKLAEFINDIMIEEELMTVEERWMTNYYFTAIKSLFYTQRNPLEPVDKKMDLKKVIEKYGTFWKGIRIPFSSLDLFVNLSDIDYPIPVEHSISFFD